MIEKEIIEGNKLIASFMGVKIGVDEINFILGRSQPNRELAINYNESWDYLMPVVEKIVDTPMEDFINEETEDGGYLYLVTFGMRTDIGEWMVRFRGQELYTADTLIKATWEAVIGFIKWNNNQHAPKFSLI